MYIALHSPQHIIQIIHLQLLFTVRNPGNLLKGRPILITQALLLNPFFGEFPGSGIPVSLDELLEDYATESGQAFDVTGSHGGPKAPCTSVVLHVLGHETIVPR